MTRKIVVGALAVGLLTAGGFVVLVGVLLGSILDGQTQNPVTNGAACGPLPDTGAGDEVVATVARAPITATPETAARAVLRAGWSIPDAVVAVAVAGQESTWRPGIRNSIGASGLFQMRLPMHADKFDGDWRDPYANARAAYRLWRLSGGWSPWVAWTSGDYRRYLPRARAAVAEVTRDAPQVRYDPATQTPDTATTKGLRPVAAAAAAFIRQQFGFNGTIGGVRDDPDSKHHHGLALDVMTSDRAVGDAIAEFMVANHARFAVDNVIWQQRISNAGRGWRFPGDPMPDRGDPTANHYDHVHIDFHDTTTTAGPVVVPAGYTAPAVDCDTDPVALAAGNVVHPLPPGTYRDNDNYGGTGTHWARGHTGNDYSAPCGTPVRAAHDGTVQVDPFQAWAGPSLVKVSTGTGRLTTWYAHMQTVTVAPGAAVTAGQTIGRVGTEGNSTGCHLHFEVHPEGGTIYEDGVDPRPWLTTHIGTRRPALAQPAAAAVSTGVGFTIATFNVLGSSHTAPGGKHPAMASGPARMRDAVRLLDGAAVDVVGFQEFQANQAHAFTRLAGDRYAWWSPTGDTENAIGWRRADWERVDQTIVAIPYFDGHERQMPAVTLRFVHTGDVFTFANFHNPADTGRYPNQGRWRREATRREIRFVARRDGATFVTGDMNEHRSYVRKVARYLVPAAPRHYNGIDWILGPPGTRFEGHTVDDGPLVDRTTDHPFMYARVLLGET